MDQLLFCCMEKVDTKTHPPPLQNRMLYIGLNAPLVYILATVKMFGFEVVQRVLMVN